ncbi:MAG: hypothetical protein AAF518_05125 [Spirochaetota bacterium]
MPQRQFFKELDELLTSPIPNFTKIERALEKVPAAMLALEIQEDAGFAYLMDYYFRHINEDVVRNILQNPLFTPEALIELFYCHITSYHKAILRGKPKPGISDSYWQLISKAELAIIFKNIIKRPSSMNISKLLLEKIDIEHLKLMTSSGALRSDSMLRLLKEIGPGIQYLAAKDMNFFDYIFNLAHDNSDEEYVLFLENYTAIFVQLSVAGHFIGVLEKQIEEEGKVPSYHELVDKCATVPYDSLPVTLDIMYNRGWITESENESLHKHLLDKYEEQHGQH